MYMSQLYLLWKKIRNVAVSKSLFYMCSIKISPLAKCLGADFYFTPICILPYWFAAAKFAAAATVHVQISAKLKVALKTTYQTISANGDVPKWCFTKLIFLKDSSAHIPDYCNFKADRTFRFESTHIYI